MRLRTCIALVLGVLALAASLPALPEPAQAYEQMPPCPTEDSVSCFWDATRHGNGLGHSFWTDSTGYVYYVEGE